MKLFDLHCDTAGECLNRRRSLLDGDMHINICKGKLLDKWCQLFAVWIPDNLRGFEAEDYFKRVYENFKSEVEQNSDKIKLCQGFSDIEDALESGRCAALLTVEGASPFAAERGAEFANLYGVKLITLTWNGENELGYGCLSGFEDGLKPAGKALLRDMKRLGIAADVSHLNRAGFYDAVSSGAAVIASHSNSESVLLETRRKSEDRFFSCRRSLDDAQIKLLAECGGLIGVNFCRSFLGDRGDDGFEAVYRHLSRIIDLGGENTAAIGSDFDGCEINPELSGIDKMPLLRAYLADKGFTEELLEKIFYKNAFEFFKNILQNHGDMI